MASCPFCRKSTGQTKCGNSRGIQRYKCAFCQRRYSAVYKARGYPDELHGQAVQLHAQGTSVREISRRLGVNHQTVANWLRSPEPLLAPPEPVSAPPPLESPSGALAKKRPTITDVARFAGVSTSTVSNYLNDKGHMGEETRSRVQDAIDRLHFTPSALVRAIRHRRTHILGVFIYGLDSLDENLGRALVPPLLVGMNRGADAAEYNLLIFTGWLYRLQRDQGLNLLDGNIDGLLWVAPEMPILERLANAGLPVVALLTRDVPDGVGYVNSDNVGGVRAIVAHLVERGHRRIAFFGPAGGSDFLDRRDSYREALSAFELSWDAELEVTPGKDEWWFRELRERALDAWLSLPSPPTAIIASDDGMAGCMIQHLQERGRRVPEDIAVTGFDDVPDAQYIGGGLTTIRQPFRQIGQVAAERLIALIDGAPAEECRVTLPAELIIRATTR